MRGVGRRTAARRWQLAAVGDVLRNRNLRRLHGGRLLWRTAELAEVVALVVYAYERGGAGEVAMFGLIRTAAAACTAPFVAVLGDRLPRMTVLTGAAVMGALGMAVAAVTVHIDAPAAVVYATSALVAVAAAVHLPTAGALVPSLVRHPAELVAHNLVGSVVEGSAALTGPVLGALLVDRLGVAGALALTSSTVAAAAVTLATLRREVADAAPRRVPVASSSVTREVTAGFREIASNPTSRLLTLLGSTQTLVRGAFNVLVVVLAVDLLGMSESSVGVLLGAIGVGSLLGGLVTVRFVSSTRLGRTLVVGLVLWGAPIAVVALAGTPAAAIAILAVIGLGNNLVDVSVFTLLQRSVPNHVLARVMGALETSLQAGVALGALLAVGLLTVFGDRGALVVTGTLLVVVAGVALPALRRLDQRSQTRDEDVALLSGIPLFRPLPLVGVEQLASRLGDRDSWPEGAEVVRTGEHADRYFVIEDGEASVFVAGRHVRTLGPGDGFGEIALLRDVPRTATVVAAGPLRLRVLEREDFLVVVTGDPRTESAARAAVHERLAADEEAGHPG